MNNQDLLEQSAPSDPRPDIVADYKLIKRIGTGAYGEVWLAQAITGSLRAIKLLYRKNFKKDAPFQREVAGIRRFEPISAEHPAFLEIMHAGPNPPKEFFYYVMELADDQEKGRQFEVENYKPKTLSCGRLGAAQCISVALDLADGLYELHARGLCHRDIKPSNVIFVHGRAKLADIGLVGVLGEAASFVGTQGYIAPEGPGTPQADIYSFGKLLYQISSGRNLGDFPALPEDFDEIKEREIFLELNEIIIKACNPDPSKRYKSARELHSDLLLLTNGDSIKRLRLLEGRLKRVREVSLVAFVILLVGGGIFYHFNMQKVHVKEMAQRKAGFHSAAGIAQMQGGDYFTAFRTFTDALLTSPGSPDQENLQRMRLRSLLAKSPKLDFVAALPTRINSLHFSTDGQFLLAGQLKEESYLFDVKNQKLVQSKATDGNWTEMAALSRDGNWIGAVGGKFPVHLWKVNDGTQIVMDQPSGDPNTIDFHPDGVHVFIGYDTGEIGIWNLETRQEKKVLVGHSAIVNSVLCSPDGDMLISASNDGRAILWDWRTDRILQEMKHPTWVYHASFSSDGKRIITSAFDKRARVWELESGKIVFPELRHNDAIRMSAISPDNSFIVTASWDGTVKFWDARTLLPLPYNNILKHENRVNAVAISPNSKQIATATSTGSLRIWDLSSQLAPFNPISATSTNARQERTAKLQEWRAKVNHPQLNELLARTNPVNWVEDGRTLAIADTNTIALWTSEGRHFVINQAVAVTRLALSKKGAHLATADFSKVYLWDLQTARLMHPSLNVRIPAGRMEFWDEDRLLAVPCINDQISPGELLIFNVETGNLQTKPMGHNDGVICAVLRKDINRVVTASEDFTAQVWNLSSGERVSPPLQHEHQVLDVQFSPSGRIVATASFDRTLRIWDAATGEPITIPFQLGEAVIKSRFLKEDLIEATTYFGVFNISIPALAMQTKELQSFAKLLCPSVQEALTPHQIREGWKEFKTQFASPPTLISRAP